MKAFRKLGAVVAAVSLGAVALAGCAGGGGVSGSDCVGKWVIDSMESGGEVITSEDLASMADLGMDMSNAFALDFKEGGVAEVIIFEEPAEGTWTGDAASCSLTVEGETLKMPFADGKLTLEESGTKIIFKRS